MYRTVLFATDATPTSDRALPEALRLLDAGGRLIVFHCDERFMAGRVGGIPVAADEPDLQASSVAMRLPHVAPCPVIVVSEQAAERTAVASR
jgi:nucleotide-binding universal stress UspA family protein